MRLISCLLLILIATTGISQTKKNDFMVNCCKVKNAPDWLKSDDFNDSANQIQDYFGWQIRRVEVYFYPTAEAYASASSLSFATDAFYSASQQQIHISPHKDFKSLSKTLKHELIHVVFNQKFKSNVSKDGSSLRAIPEWLEEGFANTLGSGRTADYAWLKKQTRPAATSMRHPNSDASGSRVHYQLSTATAEMLAAKCNLKDLFMLATGSKMQGYIERTCKIADVDKAVEQWIASR